MIKKITNKLNRELHSYKKELQFQYLSKKIEFQPVFLIGCGRSGTTILGDTIGKHKSITYLNERRDLWHKAYPKFDIWSEKTANPMLIAGAEDHITKQTNLLRKLFYREQIFQKSDILLEKLPINNFRLKFINEAFPNAKYIYLHRNGIEVAKSIEKRANRGEWFKGPKWKLIEKLFKESNTSKQSFEFSNFEKALIEWRLSLEFSESFFSTLEEERYYSLSYETFVESPKQQIENIYSFLNLDINHDFTSLISNKINRRSKKIQQIDDTITNIAGPYLKLSVENLMKQTAPNPPYKF